MGYNFKTKTLAFIFPLILSVSICFGQSSTIETIEAKVSFIDSKIPALTCRTGCVGKQTTKRYFNDDKQIIKIRQEISNWKEKRIKQYYLSNDSLICMTDEIEMKKNYALVYKTKYYMNNNDLIDKKIEMNTKQMNLLTKEEIINDLSYLLKL